MNIFQTIWSALTTPNEPLFNYMSIPLAFIDVYVCMLFFTTILNIHATKKQKVIYVFSYAIAAILSTFFVPASYKIFVNMIVWPIIIYFTLKPGILKSIIAVTITLSVTLILESIFANIFLILLNITSLDVVTIPLYRLIIVLTIYLFMLLITKLIKYFKVNINIIDNLNLKNKVLLGISLFLIIVVLCIQFCLVIFYNDSMPIIVSSANIIILIIYFTISICSIINISKLQTTKRDLESANLQIHSLTILHDQVRSFKHDFDNIVNSIGGYVVNEDMEGLKKYYNQLLEECNKTNNLYA